MTGLFSRPLHLAAAFLLIFTSVQHSSAQSTPQGRDLESFFALNAITPFHAWAAGASAEEIRSQLRKDLPRAKELGATHIRVDMWWGMIEPERGQFSWEVPDLIIEEIVSAGLKPYPILCYNSSWQPDVSPANDEERAAFGEYVYALVHRYRGDVAWWEVWNEPNTPPFWVPEANPADYTELLKVAYREAKRANPDARIAAMCTAGPDYHFIEESYRQGAAGHFDALSYHHYSSAPDEKVLETEIRTIRNIMRRHGDEDKPLLITEAGLSTGENVIMEASSPEEQAQWLVKKHLIALAEGVEQFHYFKLQDDPAESDPDGYWGVYTSEGEKKPSWFAYHTMAMRIGDARFIGRAWRMAGSPIRRGDVEFQVYDTGSEVFAAAWVRGGGDPIDIQVPAGGTPPVIENWKGEETGREPRMLSDGNRARVRLSASPVYIRNLPRQALALASARFDPSPVYLSPGESETVTMAFDNPADEEMTIRLDPFFWILKNRELKVDSGADEFSCPPAESASHSFLVSLPAGAEDFGRAEIQFNDNERSTYSLPVIYLKPFDIRLETSSQDGRLAIAAAATNQTGRPVSGSVGWGGAVGETERKPFEALLPGEAVDSSLSFQPRQRGEYQVISEAKIASGAVARESLHIYGMPFRSYGTQIDGNLADWEGLPFASLTPEENQWRPLREERRLEGDHFSGGAAVLWKPDAVHIAARVVDRSAMENAHAGSEIWRGDGLEFYFGFGGPSRDNKYGPRHFHIGLAPTSENGNPVVWNWNGEPEAGDYPPSGGSQINAASIQSRKTENGYTLEASIPLNALGVEIKEGQLIGLDIHLNNQPAGETASREVLIWNGSGENWRDPSGWGVGLISGGESN